MPACIKFSADDILKYFFLLFYPENRFWHFIQIISTGFDIPCTGDHLFEMSNLFYGKNKKSVINLSSVELAQRVVKVQLDPVLVYINLNCVELLISNSLYQENISILFIYFFLHNF